MCMLVGPVSPIASIVTGEGRTVSSTIRVCIIIDLYNKVLQYIWNIV